MGDILLWRPRQSSGSQTVPHESAYAPIIDVMARPDNLCGHCADVRADRCYHPKCPFYAGPQGDGA
jgi:hypothetical protein